MKKIILIATVAVGWIGMVYGQDNPPNSTTTTTTTTTTNSDNTAQSAPSSSDGSRKGLYFGVEFLPTFTHFDVAQVNGGTYKTSFVLGYGFGALLGVNVTDHFGLQGEVLYSALAQKYTDPSNIERRIDLNYINIPLLAVFNTNVSKPVNLNLAVGPQIGINVGSKVNTESGAGVDTVGAVLAVKTGDLGFAYGAGLDFGLGPKVQLSVGYRGVIGLVDISDNSQTTETSQYYVLDKAHVSTYAGYVGLKF